MHRDLPRDLSILTFSVQDWPLESRCRNEDGVFIVLSNWRVLAEDDIGNRWVMNVGTQEIVEHPEGGSYYLSSAGHIKEAAEAVAEKLNSKRRPRLDPNKWHYHGAAYGSAAYTSEHEAELVHFERESDAEAPYPF